MPSPTSFLPLIEKYFGEDPVRAAHHLETMDEDQAVEVLKNLPPSLAADVVESFNDVYAAGLLPRLSAGLFKKIVGHLDPQKAANILLGLAQEKRETFLEGLEEKKKRQIRELLIYPEDSAGRMMSTNFIAFHGDVKVKDAVGKIRLLAQRGSTASYVYVVDPNEHLIGILNMRDMMLASGDSPLEAVMRRDVFTVDCFMDREKVAEELTSRKFFAAPVVDNNNRLLGIVRAEQLIENIQEEATEDLQRMFGAGGDEKAFSPISFSLRQRLPWLHVNLATAFLAGWVVSLFEDVIARITVLAVYLPVVAGQGGNAGAQSLAVVMRGLVMREIPRAKVARLVFKETTIGMINGLVIGLVTALAAWGWQKNPVLGLVVGLGMFTNLLVAGLAGALIPVIMKAVRLDPAQCSSIILTTITDVMGFLVFLGFAVLFQGYLI